MATINADVVLVAKARDGDVDHLCPILTRLGFGDLDAPAGIPVPRVKPERRPFCASLAGSSAQPSGMCPSLIASF